MTTIALFGAAGKIGARIAKRLREDAAFRTRYIEAGEANIARLRASHPPIGNDETDPAARHDFWGGIAAPRAYVKE